MTPPALAVEDYSFWYKLGEGKELLALQNVCFEIQQGEFVLVLGHSGSGKSTLALNLVGIYPDYFGGRNQGRIMVYHPERGFVNRRELDAGERFMTVNMLFQNPEDQIVTLTAEEEIGFALENYLLSPAEIHARIDRVLDLVGLKGFRERSTLELSGGEKQRVALAAMLAMEPRVLILDEPTSNLDPVGTAEVLDTVARIREGVDLTLLVIEHEVDAVFDQVDRVLLVDGKTVHGPYAPRAFMADHGLRVRDEMGLWIPQAVEVGLDLARDGLTLPLVPLNGDELVRAVSSLDGFQAASDGGVLPLDGPPQQDTPGEEGEVAISVEDVHFSYSQAREVLRGVALEIRRHELLAIVGQNGSGKSTLAALFNGILRPGAGRVLVEGKATTDYKFADLVRRVAYIFQVPEKQFIRNTVQAEIEHGLKRLGLPPDEVARRTSSVLESVRLAHRREASPYVLSHGQKRRLSVACMVVSEPEVVILDEPTFGQDYQQAQGLMQLLRKLADGGAAVVFITHDMRLVGEYADRCAVLHEGQIVFEGTPGQLFSSTEVLDRAKLKAPPVYHFSRRLVGEALLHTGSLCTRIKERIGDRYPTVL